MRYIVPLLLFLFFIFESVFVDLVKPHIGIERIFVPHFILVALLMVTAYLNRTYSVIYGIVFGLTFDVVYTGVLGVYAFLFPVVAYIVSYLFKVLQTNLFVLLLSTFMGVAILEVVVYGIYYLIGYRQFEWSFFILSRLIPTLILNGGFLILLYYPFRALLLRYAEQMEQES